MAVRWGDTSLPYVKLAGTFVLFRFSQYALVIATPSKPFDDSTSILLNNLVHDPIVTSSWWNTTLWNKLLHWDAVFFIKHMVTIGDGATNYEHEFAFSKFWAWCVQQLIPIQSQTDFYYILKTAVLVTNLLHLFSVLILYELTRTVFGKNDRFNFRVALLFIFSSGAGFFTTFYSEPLSFFLAFLGLWFREEALQTKGPYKVDWTDWPLYTVGTTLCFTLATVNRSNCILLGIFYLYDCYRMIRHRLLLKVVFFPLLSGFLMLLGVLCQWYYVPYLQFCPERGEWCDTSVWWVFTRQSMYAYIQSEYWGVGFLKYWTVNNLPNFLFAVPSVVILAKAVRFYGFQRGDPIAQSLRPYCIVTVMLLFVICFCAHVQIINRVVTFLPIHLWYICDQLERDRTHALKDGVPVQEDKLLKWYVYWLMFWIPVQTVLFASFLPPA
ncbi:GPI-anchor transamidase GPI18 KNAG_0J01100 [Huiozyma naganishii CBS 8797]|uniref:GPI mannosyltransferase 2 n=1 Tax=Huiozyma naganishii (strain ATCC MYA-139 / BCRC 22969 / CBS 8797 / KCTC 17520 / NBRC 10181 / NCYC 3082 / Yp74L-3) TaxID=1071383 RepID=J7S2R0_HUIN7|nr:hypothetical protein KNAG_0J01100 [Kazachstania naganishii CBS 8797]CCK72192.1 hypothetical protein KNAG_0J01100 [Kazachstania naganishii CBS 8797]